MINLMPPDIKQNMLYAKRNSALRHWAIWLVFSIIGVAGIIGVGYLYLNNSINTYTAQIKTANETLQNEKLDETQTKIQGITNDLKLVVQVLSKEVLFSKLLQQIGSVMPNGTILTDLSIDKVQGGIDLEAAALNYQTATQVQLNLQDPSNKIFDKADLISIQCVKGSSTTTTTSQYPCTVQIRALFTSNNPFLFISKQAKGSS